MPGTPGNFRLTRQWWMKKSHFKRSCSASKHRKTPRSIIWRGVRWNLPISKTIPLEVSEFKDQCYNRSREKELRVCRRFSATSWWCRSINNGAGKSHRNFCPSLRERNPIPSIGKPVSQIFGAAQFSGVLNSSKVIFICDKHLKFCFMTDTGTEDSATILTQRAYCPPNFPPFT